MPFIFLDRDGVINEEPGADWYVSTWEKFKFIPGALQAISHLTKAGYQILVISNQGAVSKGLMTPETLSDITQKMIASVEEAGGNIAGVFYCVHQSADHCDCKKPKTGLFKQATRGLDVDFPRTTFIGDAEEDVQAGQAMGLKTILVLSGRTHESDLNHFEAQPTLVKRDLLDAVHWILGQ